MYKPKHDTVKKVWGEGGGGGQTQGSTVYINTGDSTLRHGQEIMYMQPSSVLHLAAERR